MSILSSLLAAIIPMSLYLILIWRLDRNEREPLGEILKHYFWGAVGAIILGILFSSFLTSTSKIIFSEQFVTSFFSAVIIAPFAEEIVKSIYLLKAFKSDYFDNITDGLVYGAAIGLGFGMTENILYFTMYDNTFTEWISVVLIRSIFSAVMHAISTAIVGSFVAKAKFTKGAKRQVYFLVGLFWAMVIHASWNFSVSFQFTYLLGIISMIVLIALFFMVFLRSLKNESFVIKRELMSEDEKYFNKQNDLASGKSLREISKFYNKKKERKKFVSFATKLAFRKLQVQNSEGIQKEKYLNDIDYLRQQLAQINRLEIT